MGGALAEELPPAPPLLDLARQGYAFEHPRILTRQRLFGLHHGATLLAATCVERDLNTSAIMMSALDWERVHDEFMSQTRTELLRFYYGDKASLAVSGHLVRALNLRESLAVPETSLPAACATLPEALRQPRYDLAARFALEEALTLVALAVRVEALAFFCSGADKHVHGLSEQLEVWHKANGERSAAAKARLEPLWLAQQLEGNVDSWLTVQREKPRDLPPCDAALAWLQSPAAQLDTLFAEPTAPAATAILLDAENPQAPVAVALPVAAPATESVLVPAQQSPSPVSEAAPQVLAEPEAPSTSPTNLFDWLMSLIHERNPEAAAPRNE